MSSYRSSSVDEVVLAAFTKKGLLSSKEVAHWRVLHVVSFVTVYDAFIGMEPHVDSFQRVISGNCSSDPNAFAFLDPSPVGFDDAFFRNLQVDKGLMGSDQVLYSDIRSRSTIDYYASNQGAFFGDFMAAMTKLGRIGVKTPATGDEIRRDYRFPN
ncbi:peroxidase 35-like [Miscanthus floridulus]|uniref:peroxidase 35-like n=1 Tax=Miscanthus floridulus TaxID=154761 RepID=UPI003457AA20